MRDGILAHLPSLKDGEILLLVAPPNLHNLNHIRGSVHEHNRRSNWIRTEFSYDPQIDKIGPKVKYMITSDRISGAVLTKLRNHCKRVGVPFLPIPLLPGEVKKVLDQIADMRETGSGDRKEQPSNSQTSEPVADTQPVNSVPSTWKPNGHGIFEVQSTVTESPQVREAEKVAPVAQVESVERPVQAVPESDPKVIELSTVEAPSELKINGEEQFLQTLDEMPAIFDELKLAIISIKEKNAALEQRWLEARGEVFSKQAEVDRLKKQLDEQRPKIDSLTDHNRNLTAEIQRLRQLQKAFQAVQEAMERTKGT